MDFLAESFFHLPFFDFVFSIFLASDDLNNQLAIGFHLTNFLLRQYQKDNEKFARVPKRKKIAPIVRGKICKRQRAGSSAFSWPDETILDEIERDRVLGVVESSLGRLHCGSKERNTKLENIYREILELY